MTSKAFGFEPLFTRKLDGKVQHLYRFSNGYGASIAPSSYGYENEREGAVIFWTSESEHGWEFDWTTPVAKGSERLNMPEGVEAFLTEISELPPRKGRS